MKKINTFDHLLKTYFEKNEVLLKNNYPGINYNIFYKFIVNDLSLKGEEESLEELFQKFESAIPLNYISNSKFLYDIDLYVDERVLIPRFETEILIDDAINLTLENKFESIIDIGTGSGVIILNVLKALKKKNYQLKSACASDISADALDVCRINYEDLLDEVNVDLEMVISDRFTEINSSFDLIISNPPYIMKNRDKSGVHFQTHDFEPHMALYLEDSEYNDWFDNFLTISYDKLNLGGMLLMEGHEDHLDRLFQLAKIKKFSGQIRNDLVGRKRFLYLKKE